MFQSGMIYIQDLRQEKGGRLRLGAREVWKSALSFDKEEGSQQERRRRKTKAGGMWVSKEGESGSWMWRLSKGIKITKADKKEVWVGKNEIVYVSMRKNNRKWDRCEGEAWLNYL